MVLWNMPQRVGDRARMAVILRESRLTWEALDRELGARLAEPVQGTWTAAVVYGHVGRWLELAAARLEAYLESGALPEAAGDEDATNDRWAAEDALLGVAEARARCAAAFERLHGLLAELDPNRWDETVFQLAEDDAWNHLRTHLHAIGGEDPA